MEFYFLGAALCGLLGASFALYRNKLIFDVRTKACDIIFAQDNWKGLLPVYDKGASYEKQMWQITKTKFSDFYPELAELGGK